MCKYFLPIKTATSLKEKLCLKSLLCSTNVIKQRFKNLCKESFKSIRIGRGMLLKQRKELEGNSTEVRKMESRSKYGSNVGPWPATEVERTIYLIATIKSIIYLIFTRVNVPSFLT